MSETIESSTSSTNLDGIHAAFGELFNADAVNDDDALTAELEAKDAPDEAPDEATPDAPKAPADDQPDTEPVADPFAELLASAQPFAYTVDGQPKTYDGIKLVVGADGQPERAIIDKASIADVQYKLQRGDYLETANTKMYQQVRQLDAVTFKGQDGQEVTGMQAVQQYAVQNARLVAALEVMSGALEDSQTIYNLAVASQNGDASAMQVLTERLAAKAELAAMKAERGFGQTLTQSMEQQRTTQDEPTLTANTIARSITQWAGQYPTLTDADKEQAYRMLTSFGSAVVWKASPEEARQAGVRPGEHIIDHRKVDAYLKQIHESKTAQAAATSAAQKAAKENAARLSQKAPALARKPTKATTTVPSDDEETWSQQRARMMSGNLRGRDE